MELILPDYRMVFCYHGRDGPLRLSGLANDWNSIRSFGRLAISETLYNDLDVPCGSCCNDSSAWSRESKRVREDKGLD